MAETIFSKYGGFATISRIVADFYERVLDSDIIGPIFDGIDMRVMVDHQTKFMATIMGGPVSYTNEHLERVHARHPIDAAAFDEMAEILSDTLEDHNLDKTDIGVILREITSRRPFVVNA